MCCIVAVAALYKPTDHPPCLPIPPHPSTAPVVRFPIPSRKRHVLEALLPPRWRSACRPLRNHLFCGCCIIPDPLRAVSEASYRVTGNTIARGMPRLPRRQGRMPAQVQETLPEPGVQPGVRHRAFRQRRFCFKSPRTQPHARPACWHRFTSPVRAYFASAFRARHIVLDMQASRCRLWERVRIASRVFSWREYCGRSSTHFPVNVSLPTFRRKGTARKSVFGCFVNSRDGHLMPLLRSKHCHLSRSRIADKLQLATIFI